MSKASAEELSRAGDKYLGRSYSEMDCQAFVENCLRDVGIRKDLRGSNAWWRTMTWTGTPEECVRIFGSVPNGAFLFILKDDGGEKQRGYYDGKGNASHIGLKTGRGAGAIHSSSGRGCVAESEFHDKTIKNGGWNRVGLWDQLDYGKTISWLLEHMGIGGTLEESKKEEATAMQAIARSENGKDINLRKTKGGDLLDRVPNGGQVEILEQGDEWCKIKWKGKTGWMMTQFLEIEDDFGSGDMDDEPVEGEDLITLTFTMEELVAVLPFLESVTEKIAAKVGRG